MEPDCTPQYGMLRIFLERPHDPPVCGGDLAFIKNCKRGIYNIEEK
jgi:hypothetical protein